MQDGRPMAFESNKLNDTKRRWLTHEKEMWAVVRNSCTPSPLRYALTKTRLEVELLCSCSLTSKVVQGK